MLTLHKTVHCYCSHICTEHQPLPGLLWSFNRTTEQGVACIRRLPSLCGWVSECLCVRVMQFSIACHNCMQSAWRSSWAVMHKLIISIVCSSTLTTIRMRWSHTFIQTWLRRGHPQWLNHIKMNLQCRTLYLLHCGVAF